MIVSFHPCLSGDCNRLCAGRPPGPDDLEVICRARAVLLPQGCSQALYEMARNHCAHVFPNYDARFGYPGKLGQIRLFTQIGVAHPVSVCYENLAAFYQKQDRGQSPVGFPAVFKFSWGGEGETVYLLNEATDLKNVIHHARLMEKTGQHGFLVQQYIPGTRKSLRVAVIGDETVAYWRIQPDARRFGASLSAGGLIDTDADPELQTAGIEAVRTFCESTGINLAGFDLLFSPQTCEPLFLEINYFFGRRGLGGSNVYYRRLKRAVARWLKTIES
jgi:ribosomal protein S6--L-glutamate ligase